MEKIKRVINYIYYAVAGAAAFLIGQYIVILPTAFLIHSVFRRDAKAFLMEPVPYALICMVCYGVAVLILKLLDKKQNKKSPLGLSGLPTWTDIGLGAAGFIVSFIISIIVVYVLSFLPFFDPNEAQDVGFNPMVSGAGRVLAFLALVVIGPIMEEVIFRGWMYGHLRTLGEKNETAKKVSAKPGAVRKDISRVLRVSTNLVWSIILTSLAFGVMHGQMNVAVNVFIMSVICCLLRECTGTIYAGIVLHMIKNWLAFMVIYVFHLV